MKENITIVALSDIHGIPRKTEVPQCDVVTISGDFSPLYIQRETGLGNSMCKWITEKFIPWLMSLPCERVVFIGGNHDFVTEESWFVQWFNGELDKTDGAREKIHYLQFSQYEYKGWVFYGCPLADIAGWAWVADGYEQYKPDTGTDIALYHQAPEYMYVGASHFWDGSVINYGSRSMMNALYDDGVELPKLLLCGHIHTGDHLPQLISKEGQRCVLCNVSTKDEEYNEYFFPRCFELSMQDDGTVSVDTWVDNGSKSQKNEALHEVLVV